MPEDPILRPQLTLAWERVDEGSAVIRLKGELELFTETQFRGVVEEMLAQGVRWVAVDLSEVSFVDSAGISAIIWLRKRFPGAGSVCLLDPDARHVAAMDAIQLNRIVPVYPTVQIARAEMA